MQKTAILVDGEFYLKRIRKIDQRGKASTPSGFAMGCINASKETAMAKTFSISHLFL